MMPHCREEFMFDDYLKRSMTYAEYIKLIDDLLSHGKNTGPNQSEAMFNYGKINRKRMQRVEKTIELDQNVIAGGEKYETPGNLADHNRRLVR